MSAVSIAYCRPLIDTDRKSSSRSEDPEIQSAFRAGTDDHIRIRSARDYHRTRGIQNIAGNVSGVGLALGCSLRIDYLIRSHSYLGSHRQLNGRSSARGWRGGGFGFRRQCAGCRRNNWSRWCTVLDRLYVLHVECTAVGAVARKSNLTGSRAGNGARVTRTIAQYNGCCLAGSGGTLLGDSLTAVCRRKVMRERGLIIGTVSFVSPS